MSGARGGEHYEKEIFKRRTCGSDGCVTDCLQRLPVRRRRTNSPLPPAEVRQPGQKLREVPLQQKQTLRAEVKRRRYLRSAGSALLQAARLYMEWLYSTVQSWL